jgi:hypothetical protein
MKQRADISQWTIINRDWEKGVYRLQGIITNHPKQFLMDENSPTNTTSHLESIDFVNRIAITRNTIYNLL